MSQALKNIVSILKKVMESMYKITAKVNGMQCGMCEAHVNDAIRSAFTVKKVSSSRKKGETVIVTEKEISEEAIRDVIGKNGYEVTEVAVEPYEKKGLFR